MLDVGVQRGIGREAGCMVDLQEKRLEAFGDEHIESKNMEAHVAGVLFRLTVAVLMAHKRSVGEQRLNYRFVNLGFEQSYVLSLLLQQLVY